MKYLNDYTEEAISAIMEKHGAFFAFSNRQFDEKKKEGIKYVQLGSGMICPSDNGITLMKEIIGVGERGRQQDLKENGREGVIERELYNHEAFYTGDIESTVDALEGYGITQAEVRAVYIKERNTESVKRAMA